MQYITGKGLGKMINHKHKFLFIHIPKTAGRSIEKYFHSVGIYADDEAGKYKDVTGSQYDETLIEPHLLPQDYLDIYGESILSYFWFCFVRNPFERAVSEYFYSLDKKLINSSFEQFLEKKEIKNYTYKNHELKQLDFILNEKKIFDFIGRFENFKPDFNLLLKKLDLPYKDCPHINQSNHVNYRNYYNEKTRNFISVYYKEDLSYFNYGF